MTSTSTILVPLGRSSLALAAMPVARTLARIHGATLHVLHVAGRRIPPAELIEALALKPEQRLGIVLHGRAGEPAQSIVSAAAEMPGTLLVMSTHSGAHGKGRGLGRIAERVLIGASCPIVFVPPERGGGDWELHKVLLPHDGTPTTGAAFRPGAELAAQAHARLLVAHVAAPGAPSLEPGSLPTPRYLDQPQYEWPSWATEFIERAACECGFDSTRLRLLFGRGEPADEVIRFAKQTEADLIVLAWHGALEAPHARVVKAVLRAAACPVMVVRTALPPCHVGLKA